MGSLRVKNDLFAGYNNTCVFTRTKPRGCVRSVVLHSVSTLPTGTTSGMPHFLQHFLPLNSRDRFAHFVGCWFATWFFEWCEILKSQNYLFWFSGTCTQRIDRTPVQRVANPSNELRISKSTHAFTQVNHWSLLWKIVMIVLGSAGNFGPRTLCFCFENLISCVFQVCGLTCVNSVESRLFVSVTSRNTKGFIKVRVVLWPCPLSHVFPLFWPI